MTLQKHLINYTYDLVSGQKSQTAGHMPKEVNVTNKKCLPSFAQLNIQNQSIFLTSIITIILPLLTFIWARDLAAMSGFTFTFKSSLQLWQMIIPWNGAYLIVNGRHFFVSTFWPSHHYQVYSWIFSSSSGQCNAMSS